MFSDDREIVLSCVRKQGELLEFASERLRSDIEVVKTAILCCPHALDFADVRLKCSIDLVLFCAKVLAIKIVHTRNRRWDIVNSEGLIVPYGSDKLKIPQCILNDSDMLGKALYVAGPIVVLLPSVLRNDENIAILALSQCSGKFAWSSRYSCANVTLDLSDNVLQTRNILEVIIMQQRSHEIPLCRIGDLQYDPEILAVIVARKLGVFDMLDIDICTSLVFWTNLVTTSPNIEALFRGIKNINQRATRIWARLPYEHTPGFYSSILKHLASVACSTSITGHVRKCIYALIMKLMKHVNREKISKETACELIKSANFIEKELPTSNLANEKRMIKCLIVKVLLPVKTIRQKDWKYILATMSKRNETHILLNTMRTIFTYLPTGIKKNKEMKHLLSQIGT